MKLKQLPNIEIADQDLGYMNWNEAMNSCPKGWRLPTQRELMIIWASLSEDELDKYGFAANYYWASTENSATSSWCVGFSSGSTTTSIKPGDRHARCVRDIADSTIEQSVSKQDVLAAYREYLSGDIESKVERLSEMI